MTRWLPILFLLSASAMPQELKLERIVELKGTTYHVQGVDFDGTRVWVTSVDTPHQRSFLQEFSLPAGQLVRQIELGDGVRFHAGGISLDGESLWIPVADYRRNSSSVIERRSKRTLGLESRFEVSDHIGCIAAAPDYLIGGNWDSKEFYFWDRRGVLVRRVASDTANAYQDLKFEAKQIVASGLLADRGSAIDWLDYPSLHRVRRLRLGNTDRGVPFSREGMAIHGKQIMLLPEDGPSRLFIFNLN